MINLINSIYFLLSQTETEKRLTVIGIAVFIGFMFFLVLDSVIKQKFVPKSPVVRYFLIFLMIIGIIALGVYFIFIK